MSIRVKIALPFLLLTVIVALIGVYVVTRLVTGSMTERLTNQLLESGRVVSDSFIRQERQHVNEALRIAYTQGLAEAVLNEDRTAILQIAEPAFVSGTVDNLILVSPRGNEVAHFLRDANKQPFVTQEATAASQFPIVAPLLQSQNPDEPPRRALGINLVNNELYYYTALPISLNGTFYGVVVMGTSLRTLLPIFKQVALADIVIYSTGGQAIATTFAPADQETLDFLSISAESYQVLILSEDLVTGNNFEWAGRSYMLGRAPLQIGNDRIGVFGVALPLDFVLQFGADNRLLYAVLFTAIMLVVITIGGLIARSIIKPLYSLVNTSLAIAGGDLTRRTGLRSKDEIGTLATTFDDMTARLQQRTKELEEANATLKKMDKIKSNFIQISAHELRTPLTLVMGYSQMLEQDVKENPELAGLARGILEGAERMTDVVESMLDMSRIDSDSLILKRVNLEINGVIRKVQKNYEKAFAERNITFKSEGLEDLPAISADPELLQKVFSHLIMNAIKFTPDGGQIGVVGRYVNGKQPPQVEVEVCDTGIGIDPEMKSLIFNKFSQIGEVLMHSSGKTKFKGGGPGLGLAIARGIVQAHGGRIWVESPGHNEETFPGSRFIVSLPAPKESGKSS
ncbi:MAG: HAMP domain-containing protein [Chloroflexi bacterium]|nr:HAMP domain-containing protein [Chloroflexota bacterium]